MGLGRENPYSARGKMFFPPSRLDTLQSSEPDPPIVHVSSNEVGPKPTRAVQEAATAVVGSGQRFGSHQIDGRRVGLSQSLSNSFRTRTVIVPQGSQLNCRFGRSGRMKRGQL